MAGSPDRKRGPSPKFDLDDAVNAALKVGLADFSLASVATELGFSTPSLYRVIDSRDHLIDNCLYKISRTMRLPDPSLDWTDQLRAFTDELWRLLEEYPGLGAVLITRPLSTTHAKDYIWQLVDNCQAAGYGEDRMGLSFGLMMLSEMILINHLEVEQRRSLNDSVDEIDPNIIQPKGRISLSQRLFFRTDEIWLERGNLSDKVNFILAGMEALRSMHIRLEDHEQMLKQLGDDSTRDTPAEPQP